MIGKSTDAVENIAVNTYVVDQQHGAFHRYLRCLGDGNNVRVCVCVGGGDGGGKCWEMS
jgi:hypothetical protein